MSQLHPPASPAPTTDAASQPSQTPRRSLPHPPLAQPISQPSPPSRPSPHGTIAPFQTWLLQSFPRARHRQNPTRLPKPERPWHLHPQLRSCLDGKSPNRGQRRRCLGRNGGGPELPTAPRGQDVLRGRSWRGPLEAYNVIRPPPHLSCLHRSFQFTSAFRPRLLIRLLSFCTPFEIE